MRFGTSTWFFQEYSVVEALKHILNSGFHAAEIWMEHLWRSEQAPEEIVKHAHDMGMELTLHSASYDVNITSTNPGIRQESLRQIKQSIIVGKQLGVTTIVVHPGRLSSSKGNIEKCWTQMEETFFLINKWAQQEGLMVGIEAMEKRPQAVYMLPDHIKRMLSMGWTNIGLTLDIAHAFTHMDPVKYIQQLERDWIVHVHLSDGSRQSTHLPLGKGEIDIDAALSELHKVYKGLVIIEGIVPFHGQETVASNRAYLQELGWIFSG